MEQIKQGMLYTAEQLERIYRQMLPGRLLIPMIQEVGPSPAVGPKFMVFRHHSELGLEPAEPEAAYWDALGQADIADGIGEMSWINGNLSEARATDQQVHLDLAGRFVEPDVLAHMASQELQGGATSVVFNRIGCLLTIRHLMLFGGTNPKERNAYRVGRLALLANDFIQNTPIPPTSNLSSLDVLLFMSPTWDVYTSRNLGHAIINLQLLSLAYSPMPAHRRPKFVFYSTPRKYSPRPDFLKNSWNSTLRRAHGHSMSSEVYLVREPSFRKPPSRMN